MYRLNRLFTSVLLLRFKVLTRVPDPRLRLLTAVVVRSQRLKLSADCCVLVLVGKGNHGGKAKLHSTPQSS